MMATDFRSKPEILKTFGVNIFRLENLGRPEFRSDSKKGVWNQSDAEEMRTLIGQLVNLEKKNSWSALAGEKFVRIGADSGLFRREEFETVPTPPLSPNKYKRAVEHFCRQV